MAFGLQVFNSDGSIEVDTSTKVGKLISVTDYFVSATSALGNWFTKSAPGATTDATTIVLVILKGNGSFYSQTNDPNNSATSGGTYVVSANNVTFYLYQYVGTITVLVMGY